MTAEAGEMPQVIIGEDSFIMSFITTLQASIDHGIARNTILNHMRKGHLWCMKVGDVGYITTIEEAERFARLYKSGFYPGKGRPSKKGNKKK